MSCPTHETLIGFAAGDLDTPERQSVATHLLTDCPSCAATIREIGDLRALAAPAVLEAPQHWTFERAARIPADLSQRRSASVLGRVATLVFDTARSPLQAGARAAAASSRQLLFRALDYDIDVRIADREKGQVEVSGQILPGSDRPIEAVSGVEMELVSDGRAISQCSTSELGEFDFGLVPVGDYSLNVEADEDRILVERLTADHD